MSVARIAFTPGEPAGVGPDLAVRLAQLDWPVELVVIGNSELLQQRAELLQLPLVIRAYQPVQPARPQQAGTLTVCEHALNAKVQPQQLDPRNANYVLQTLQRAAEGCLSGEFAALVTGPVHKGVINDAGHSFSGHTEFFADISHTDQVVMMLATDGLRVALVTTHLPLAAVASAIT